jgi:hypothetical protein
MAQIRACVAVDLTYQTFLTWYDDGTVLRWWRGSDYTEAAVGVHTLAAFNELLAELEVYPLGNWRKRRREPETELIPF